MAELLSLDKQTRSRSALEESFDRILFEMLRPVTLVLSIVYAAFTVFNVFELPEHAVRPIVISDLVVLGSLVAIRFAYSRQWLRPSWSHPLTTVVAFLIAHNILLALALVKNPIHITHLSILIIGAGCMYLSAKWLGIALAGLFVSGTAVAWYALAPDQFLHSLFNYFAVTAFAAAIRTARARSAERMQQLLLRDEERKRQIEQALADAERELKERRLAEERHRELVQEIDAIVWEADIDTWQFTFVSDYAEKVLGYPARQWTEEHDFWTKHVYAEDLEKAMSYCKRLTDAGRDHEFEYRAVAKDGRLVWIRDIVHIVKDADGRPSQLRGLMFDITSLKENEDEKLKLEAQLRQAQKMEAVGTLAGGIAHDFNNLLAGILGYADMIRQDSNSGPRHLKAAQVIMKAGERAAQLTKQLLGFARRGKMQNAAVNINEAVLEATALLTRTLNKNIRIHQRLSGSKPRVQGDPDQLQQVIMNLAINARDAMPEGGDLSFATDIVHLGEDYCARYPHAREGDYVLLNVTDSGSGIPTEIQERIFEPFFTTKEPGQGTGMGLAMVYGIVKNHAGTVQVYSEPGLGTTFKVYLPLAAGRIDGTEQKHQTPAVVRGSGRILVVDDEETVREVASDMLRDLGYDVITAVDGQAALELYEKMAREIDLIIMDMIMPRIDGRECFRRMREINPGVRAILSSGFSCDGSVQEILNEGMRGFTQKPYRVSDLSQAVANALR